MTIRWSGVQRFKGGSSHLATFLLDHMVVPKPVNLRDALDGSVIIEALEAWKKGKWWAPSVRRHRRHI